MFYGALFLLSAGLNILLGLRGWPAVLAGSLTDPDSYMRLLRLQDGIRAGHLVLTVARDGPGAGVMIEWSRLLDMLLWLMAAPLALVLGWHRALFVAGVALGPLGVGALGVALAWVAEPFAARTHLWSAAVAAALLPGLLTFAVPGVVHYHILLLALIAATVGFVARAWQEDTGHGFMAGLCGGFAIWLTPETMPFVLMAFAALLLRWTQIRLGATLTACAAGFFDVLCFALVIDPPQGGYGVAEIDRLSLVYVLLALLLLAGAGVLWRLESQPARWRVPIGVGLMAALLLGWVALFPGVAMGPYGLMPPAEMKKFFGVMLELQPVRGAALVFYLTPGALALGFALAKAMGRRGRWLWLYVALCLLVALLLGQRFILFVGFSAAAAAAILPIMLSEVSWRLQTSPLAAMLGRIIILIAMLGAPELAAQATSMAKPPKNGTTYPGCSLRHIAPLLAPLGRVTVLAQAEYTPELLYRTRIETVGSLYQHGVAGFLRDRAAWRAIPGKNVPEAILATGARDILFCPQAARYPAVANLPHDTLWDELNSNHPPPWLQLRGTNAAGWRLYQIIF